MIRKALRAPFRLIGAGLKAFGMRWTGRSQHWWQFLLPRTNFNYAREVGDGTGNSIVVACVSWIARTFPEAPVAVVEEMEDGHEERVGRHELARRIERPNPHYPGALLWYATLVDRTTSGNAYWLKVRSREPGGIDGLGKVVEYWWAPSGTMEPKWPEDGGTFISHYEYRPDPGREAVEIDPRDVVHFRYGLDPANTRKGLGPLLSVLKEIFTDEEAASMTASLLRNLGVPGVVISPEAVERGGNIEVDDAEEIKDTFTAKFGGDKRGEPMVMTRPTKVQVMSFSPEQMELRGLRRVPEERVSGVLGVPAIVAGLGAGLDRATFDNVEKLVEFAVEQGIVPVQRVIAAELTIQALPDFDNNPNRRVVFDLTNVRALQPDMDKVYERVDRAVRGGWLRVDAAQRMIGAPADENQRVYLRPFTTVPVPADAPPSPPPAPKSGRKGSGDPSTGSGQALFVARLAETRSRILAETEESLTAFFSDQAARVMERLHGIVSLRSSNGVETKDAVIGARELLPAEEDGLLEEALRPLWLMALSSGWGLAAAAYGLEGEFEAESTETAAALGEARFRAQRINDGTRDALAAHFEEARRRGYSLRQAIDGVTEDDFPPLRDRAESYYAGRPSTVAVTEAMWATNMGTSAVYRSNGIARVQMIDGGTDAPCVARNGRIVSVSAGEAATFEEFVGLYNEWIREQRERGKIKEPFPDWLKRSFGKSS